MSKEMGKRIKQRRKELGLSQDALARRMGYNDRSIIAKFETGRSVPDGKIPDLAAALETTPAYLLGVLQENLITMDITVEEDAFGNAVVTDRKTGAQQQYSKPEWIQLQENMDFRKIFQYSGKTVSPAYLVRMNRTSKESAECDTEPLSEPQVQNKPLSHKSFQDLEAFRATTEVLDDVAVKGMVNPFDALKENVIAGKLIPTGASLMSYRIGGEDAAEAVFPDPLEKLFGRLQELTAEELSRVDAFVQGILSSRKKDET